MTKPPIPQRPIAEIEAMRMGTSYRGSIGVRGFTLSVRPLSIGEMVQVSGEVVTEMSRLPEGSRLKLTEATMMAQKTLVLASTSDVGTKDPHFTEGIAQRCTPDEIQYLFDQYIDLCDRVNPMLEEMPKDQLLPLVADLKKNPLALTKLSRSQLLPMVVHFLSTIPD